MRENTFCRIVKKRAGLSKFYDIVKAKIQSKEIHKNSMYNFISVTREAEI